MPYLIDTNVLVRLANASDAQHATARRAVLELHRRGEALHLTAQVLIEFRSVATRPISARGLGLSTTDAETQAAGFEASFALLPETADVYPAWKALVQTLGIIGKQVHDARLVAVCHVSHFVRLAGFGPGVVVVDPATV